MEINLLTIFITGLFAGGLSCLAVQGGLLTATLSQEEEFRLKSFDSAQGKSSSTALPILSFVLAKLVAYTILGFLLGWLGSFMHLSIQAQVALQFAVVLFMVATALHLLNVHPIFRYVVIQPPRFFTRLIRKQSKTKSVFAPALLGALTVVIPCGTTQAMMALAVASSNPFTGAAILFAFVLGTSPIFFLLGYFTMKLGDVLQKRFMKVAAFAILLLALFNLEATIVLSGSPYTMRTLVHDGFCLVSYCEPAVSPELVEGVSEQAIEITANGYSPNYFAVKAGSTVTLHLTNKGGFGCTQAFTIPSLHLQQLVQPGTSADFTFTAPSKPGRLTFTCSMGMYPGTIEVVE